MVGFLNPHGTCATHDGTFADLTGFGKVDDATYDEAHGPHAPRIITAEDHESSVMNFDQDDDDTDQNEMSQRDQWDGEHSRAKDYQCDDLDGEDLEDYLWRNGRYNEYWLLRQTKEDNGIADGWIRLQYAAYVDGPLAENTESRPTLPSHSSENRCQCLKETGARWSLVFRKHERYGDSHCGRKWDKKRNHEKLRKNPTQFRLTLRRRSRSFSSRLLDLRLEQPFDVSSTIDLV